MRRRIKKYRPSIEEFHNRKLSKKNKRRHVRIKVQAKAYAANKETKDADRKNRIPSTRALQKVEEEKWTKYFEKEMILKDKFKVKGRPCRSSKSLFATSTHFESNRRKY